MQHTIFHHDDSLDLPVIRQVSVNSPFKWLAAGWRDFLRTPLYSGFYGLVFVLLGYAVTALSWQSPLLIFTFATGFFLIGPFLALGLYDLSRQNEQTKQVSFIHSLFAFKQNKREMGILAIFHVLIMVAWLRLATIIGALYFSHSGTSVTVLFDQLWQTGEGIEMFTLFTLSGAILAAVVFVASAVSWPMILDRKSSVINTLVTSYKAVMKNKQVMLVWAALIGVLFIIGLATLYLALLVIIPVLGHATWHAYKELVE